MKKRILCMGDSNTWGYIPGSGERYSEDVRWTGRLAAFLGDAYVIVEEGMNGRTTAFSDKIESGVCALDYLYPCLISQFPLDCMIIMLGTNDTKDRYGVGAEEIGYGMDELLLQAENVFRRKDQYPEILVIAPVIPVKKEDWIEFSEVSVKKAKELGHIYKGVAAAHGCGYLDAAAVIKADDLGCDGIHFTAAAHEKLAKAIYGELSGRS